MWRILIGLIIIWRVVMWTKNWKLIKLSRQLKMDAICFPLIGHAHIFFGNDEDHMKAFQYLGRQALKHNGTTSGWMGDQLFIMTAEPEIAECIGKKFLDKVDIVSKALQPVIGKGSIFAPVSIWRPRRKIQTANFSQKQLNHFVSIFAKQSSIMVDLLKSRVKAGPFSIWDYLTTYTMDAVCESTLGVKIKAQTNPNHEFLKKFEICSELAANRIVTPWQYHDVIYKLSPSYRTLKKCSDFLKSFIDDIIKSKRKDIEERSMNVHNNDDTNATTFKTFLELLLTSSSEIKEYSDLELREETSVLLFAGTDTSAVGSAYVSVMLGRYPDVQEKVYQELKEVFGDSNRAVTPEDLPHLKYLDAVIRETLRLYPPVPIVSRHCDRDYTSPSGITFIQGCMLTMNIWATHRNKKYWGDNAESFRPERFLEAPLKHPAQFMPFSYGPRNCLGYRYAMMSMKTALATLLRIYRILPDAAAVDGQHKPLRLKFDIMMKDVDNFIVQLQMRDD